MGTTINNFFFALLISSYGFLQTAIENAEIFIANNKFVLAQTELIPFLKGNSEDLKGIELLGDTYGHQKRWDEAIIQYKILTVRRPQNAKYQYKYGGALAMKALSVGKLSALSLIGDIKKSFLRAAELDPNHIDVRWALVELYISLPRIIGGSITKALKYAKELERLSMVDGYLAKGYIYEYDDEPELAEKYYRLAVVVGGSVTCYEKLSAFYEGQNQPDTAIATIELAQQKQQRNRLHYQIGKVSADYNVQLDKGEKCLLAYLSHYSAKDGVPKEWAYYRLAQIYKHKKHKLKALEYINKALVIRPKFEQALKEKTLISEL